MTRVLVTGANGFVGSTLCNVLVQSGFVVRAAVRQRSVVQTKTVEEIIVGDINADTNWNTALQDVDFVVHAAARVHVLRDSLTNAARYLETNTYGTQRLASESSRLGARKFIYLSSIKVNGELTLDRPFTENDQPNPMGGYAISKLKAECSLVDIARSSPMKIAVIRPPLVYGPGVGANFLKLMASIYSGVPLPLGAVTNRRSMVSVWNLCDLIRCALESTALLSSVLLVSDGLDLATPDLIRRIAAAMGRSSRLISVPQQLLRIAGKLMNRGLEVERLLGSLQVDITGTCIALDWVPPLSVDEGLTRTVDWFRETYN